MLRRPAVIIGLCSAAALFAGACGGSDERSTSTRPGLSTSLFFKAVQVIVNLATGDPDSVVDLNACPLGDFDTLVAKAPAEVQAVAVADAQLFAYVYQPEGQTPHVQCGRGHLGAYTGELPGDNFRADLVALLPDYVLTFDDERAYRAGTVVRFCAEPIGADGEGFCEADWFNYHVWLGVFIDDESRSSDLAEQWLIAILDDVVANVPEFAPSIQLAG